MAFIESNPPPAAPEGDLAGQDAPADMPFRLPIEAKRHPVVSAVRSALVGPCDVGASEDLLIGVSGGADSLALLIALLAIRGVEARSAPSPSSNGILEASPRRGGGDPENGRLAVAHVHHHLRGDAADADARFVERLARHFDLPFRRIDIHPAAEPGNLEANARALRYDALASAAADHGASIVMVGHHADDQLETMLMRFARGAGVEGLVGLRWRRPLAPSIDLVRPLLAVRRADCASLCEAAGMAPRHDDTNDDLTRARAALRHEILPQLEALHPGVAERASALSESLAAAADALHEKTRAQFAPESRQAWPRGDLAVESRAVIAAVLQRAAVTLRADVRDSLTQAMLLEAADRIRDDDRRPRLIAWPAGLQLRIAAREVAIRAPGPRRSQ